MNKTLKFRILIFTLLICWMAIIFMFSSQPAKQSSKMSSGFVSAVITVICPEYSELTDDAKANITDKVTFVVRKTAHFSEYFVLGVLAFLTAVTFKKYKIIYRSMASFVICVLYSVSDEFHQYFVSGRACRFTDILIDSAGSLLAIVLMTFIFVKNSQICGKLGE